MLIDPEGKEYTYALRFEFETTNNEAEYEALLAGLRIAQEMEIAKVIIFLDSQLLYTVEHVRRNQNKKADALSKTASMTFEHLTKEVLIEVLTKRSIVEKEILKVDMLERKGWMDPIHEYLLSGLLPEDTKEARKIRIQAPQYKLIRGNLTLPRNSQKETPFSLTYGSEAEIPIIEATDDRGRVQKATKVKESKEVASIEKAYYRNKLRKYHNARSSHPMYIVGDFVLLKRNANEWQGPYIINEVHKEELYTIVDTTDHSLVQTTKGTSLCKFYM
ncbi:reverse transcriptase domain-containing protein [Tanacetum coccineum]